MDNVKTLLRNRPNARAFSHLFYATASSASTDNNHRILCSPLILPKYLSYIILCYVIKDIRVNNTFAYIVSTEDIFRTLFSCWSHPIPPLLVNLQSRLLVLSLTFPISLIRRMCELVCNSCLFRLDWASFLFCTRGQFFMLMLPSLAVALFNNNLHN